MAEHEDEIGEEGVLPDEPDPGVYPPVPEAHRPPRFPPLGPAALSGVYQRAREYVETRYWSEPAEVREGYIEQVVLGIRWLQRVWGPGRRCPYCTNDGWAVGVPVQIITGSLVPDTTVSDDLQRVYPVECTNCGQTVFVSEIYVRQGARES